MIYPFGGHLPKLHPSVWVAPSADLIGDLEIGKDSSVWFQVVIRGDVNFVRIGSRTNIQDHSMLHVTRGAKPLVIGDEVTIGHRVTLHSCQIGNRVLIGMGAILLDHCEIGDDSMIGAGSVVTKGKVFPPRSLILGSPAKVVRELTDAEIQFLKKSAANYVGDVVQYRKQEETK